MGTFSVLELILNLGYCYCPADCRPPEISHQSENKTLSDLNTQPSHQTLFLKLKLVNYKFSCNSSESLFMLKDLRPDQISIDNTAPPTQLELPLDLLKKKNKKNSPVLTLTTVSPLGAYLYGFRESTFIAILSFQPSSSTFCHGVSVLGSRNLTLTPATKHCQAGVGQE